jgi:uncharacterized membrane protein
MGGRTPQEVPAAASEKLRQAKRPVMLLAGPYGHPLHPILVTVPIGAWTASLCFDVASRLSTAADDTDAFAKGAYWLIALGIVGALLAASIGLLDLVAIPTGTPAFRTGLLHMTLNLVVVALFAVSFVVRHDEVDAPGETSVGLIALSVAALAFLSASGWLGGKLSYRYGVRVADETTQAEGFLDSQGAN